MRRWLDAGDATPAETTCCWPASANRCASPRTRCARARAARGRPEDDAEERPSAQDLVALLDVLASPQHDLSLARVLKSPLLRRERRRPLAWRWRNREPARLVGCAAGAGRAVARAGPSAHAAARLDRGRRRAAAARPARPHRSRGRPACAHGRGRAARANGRRRSTPSTPCSRQALLLDGGRYSTPYDFVRALRRRSREGGPAGADRSGAPADRARRQGPRSRRRVRCSTPTRKARQRLARCCRLAGRSASARCAAPSSTTSRRCPPSLQDAVREEEAARRARRAERALRRDDARAAAPGRSARPRPTPRRSGTTWWQRRRQAVPDALPLPQAGTMALACDAAPLPPARAAPPAGGRPPASRRSGQRVFAGDRRRRRGAGRRARPGRAPRARMGRRRRRATALDAARGRRRGASSAPTPGEVRRHAAAHPRPCRHAPASSAARRSAGAATRLPVERRRRGAAHRPAGAARGGRRRAGLVGARLQAAPGAGRARRRTGQQLLRYRAGGARAQPGEAVRCAFITGEGGWSRSPGRVGTDRRARPIERALDVARADPSRRAAPRAALQSRAPLRLRPRCRPLSPRHRARSSTPGAHVRPFVLRPPARQERADDGLARVDPAPAPRLVLSMPRRGAGRRRGARRLARTARRRGAAGPSRTSRRSLESGVHDHWPYVAVDRRVGSTLDERLRRSTAAAAEERRVDRGGPARRSPSRHEAGIAHRDLQLHTCSSTSAARRA